MQNNEALEQERLQQLQQLFNKYSELLNDSMPPVQEAAQDLTFTAAEISPEADVELACSTHGTGPNQPVQVLLDVYVSTGIWSWSNAPEFQLRVKFYREININTIRLD